MQICFKFSLLKITQNANLWPLFQHTQSVQANTYKVLWYLDFSRQQYSWTMRDWLSWQTWQFGIPTSVSYGQSWKINILLTIETSLKGSLHWIEVTSVMFSLKRSIVYTEQMSLLQCFCKNIYSLHWIEVIACCDVLAKKICSLHWIEVTAVCFGPKRSIVYNK